MGADRANRRADPPAIGPEARYRPHLVLHARCGVPADRVAFAAGRLVVLFPERRGAGLEAQRHLRRHDAVHGAAGDRPRSCSSFPPARALASGCSEKLTTDDIVLFAVTSVPLDDALQLFAQNPGEA